MHLIVFPAIFPLSHTHTISGKAVSLLFIANHRDDPSERNEKKKTPVKLLNGSVTFIKIAICSILIAIVLIDFVLFL